MTPASLQPPEARQGPGPIPQSVVDRLEPRVTTRVARTLPGDRKASGLGAGTELAQIRPYTIGDDVRHIDAAATARTGVAHVRLHVPERTLTTWLAIDVSPSMAFGSALRLKADVAEGAAMLLGRLAVRRAGAVGAVLFGAGDAHVMPPRGSKPGLVALRRTLALGAAADGTRDDRALADALTRLDRLARLPGMVCVISDFRDQRDWAGPLGALRARHSVLAIEVGDPREDEVPDVGRLAVVDPETGQLLEVDTSHRGLRERFAALETERRAALLAELRRLRVEHVRLRTDQDWLSELGKVMR
ncbi:MAG: DUF58 domain-containing protein [Solirubrobacteraceae bacterium]